VACLDDDAIALFVEGDATPDAAAEIRQHIAACEVCSALVEDYAVAFGLPSAGVPTPGVPAGDRTVPLGLGLTEGDLFGRYVIMALAGRGGMGEVYVAYDPELDRKLALKIVLPRKGTSSDREAALLNEARHAAGLAHPNVVAVFDVGSVDGRAFIAMEYVDGQPLSVWLRSSRTQTETLAVFADAARGLHAAHEAGIVHRDFKPGNVLVGRDGRARVADFGLARSLSDAAGREVAGTPGYMAPEQRRGQPIGPPADQYAFAVSLYEALHGHRPGWSTTTRSGTSEEASSAADAGAESDPKRHRLDAVLRRALSPEPRDRFASMAALAEELEPQATRRWPWVAGLAALAVAMIVGAGPREATTECEATPIVDDSIRMALAEPAGATGQRTTLLTRMEAYDESLVAQRVLACREQASRAAVACLDGAAMRLSSVVDAVRRGETGVVDRAIAAMGGLVEPEGCRDDERTARLPQPESAMLDEAVWRVRNRIAAADGHMWVGDEMRALTELDVAWKEALPLEFAPVEIEIRQLQGFIAAAHGRLDDAEAKMSEAYHRAESIGYAPAAALAAVNLVHFYGASRVDIEAALEWSRHAESAIDRGGTEAQRSELHAARGLALLEAGRYDEGREDLEQALALREAIHHTEPAELIEPRHNLALALLRTGEVDAGAVQLEQALRDAEVEYGLLHPSVGTIASSLAVARDMQDRDDEAKALYRRSIEVFEQGDAPRTQALAATLDNLAIVHLEHDEPEQALPLLLRAESVLVDAVGAAHPDVASTRSMLATAHADLGRLQEAARYHALAEDTTRASYPADHVVLESALRSRSSVERDLGNFGTAAGLLDEVLEIREHREGLDDPERASALMMRGAVERKRGALELAEHYQREALALLERLEGAREGLRRDVLEHLALVLRDGQRFEEARQAIDDAIELDRARDADHQRAGALHSTRGTIELRSGRPQDAIVSFELALTIAKRRQQDRLTVHTLRLLAGAQELAGQTEAAQVTLVHCRELARTTPGGAHELSAAEALLRR